MDVLGQDRREGLGRRSETRAGLITLLFASMLLLLSGLYSAEASVFRKARETVIDAAAPVLALFAGPIAYVQDVVGDVGDYFRVLQENQALREENAELRQWMYEALSMRETIAAYERLQNYPTPPGASPVNAFVVGESNDAFAHSMLLGAGSDKGVARRQAVIDDRGLVGRIVDAGRSASRVLLLTDIQSRVPVFIDGANVEGILVGRTNARPAITFTESSEPVEFSPGQRVITSGAGGVMPRGLPVGTVLEERNGEAIVELYANYARTRMVRVINYDFPQIAPTPATPPETEAAPETADDAPAAPPEPVQTDDEMPIGVDEGETAFIAGPAGE